ncbi:energy transducer TonB [Amaricoccus solimangrovi]|uniref:Energy transducer TonB n=1 Tax=Amaricoccus solimangrovi TaxID=2589815 RepID=A0A501WNL9_9RHOB|nr:energy transducer TonB [Amaricoccus solimangrovi]TPE49935.1 energy transducer TonB [Amaricoccus solimangrovi]
MTGAPDHPVPVGDLTRAWPRHPLREAGAYAAAGMAVLALHAGVAVWATRSGPEPLSDAPAAAEAVLIDLAPEPVAPVAEETRISDSLTDAPPAETEPLDPPTALDEVETVAPPDPAEEAPPRDETPRQVAEPAPPAEPDPPALDTAEAVLPAKPPPRPPAETPRAAEPAPPKKTPPRESVRRTSKQPAVPAAATRKWQSRLLAHLERRKRYPAAARRRGDEGVATLSFSIDPAGNVLSARLSRSSGVAELDAEVLAMVRRASPVPPPPPGSRLDIAVPVRFAIR